ncbi:MAG TPA: CoA-binding protein [Gemmatimonadales bacterium]|nr:CoA-binding protein [Gemmatimonadales bacterium]
MSVTEELMQIVAQARTIAVVGLSPNPERPSHGVARYLQTQGYRIVPVTPKGGAILGEPAYPDLRAAAAALAPTPIDIVDVFRRAETLPDLVPDILAVRPRLAWFQLGIRSDVAATALEAAGIPVVQDHCLAVEHTLRRRP